MHVADKNAGFVLSAKHEGMPEEASAELGDMSEDNDNNHAAPTRNRNNKNKRKRGASSTNESNERKLISFTEKGKGIKQAHLFFQWVENLTRKKNEIKALKNKIKKRKRRKL